MKKKKAFILSFLPLVAVIGSVFLLMLSSILAELMENTVFSVISIIMVLITFIIFLAIFVISIIHIVMVFRRSDLDMGMKILWAMLLYLFNVIAFPIYWFANSQNKTDA